MISVSRLSSGLVSGQLLVILRLEMVVLGVFETSSIPTVTGLPSFMYTSLCSSSSAILYLVQVADDMFVGS